MPALDLRGGLAAAVLLGCALGALSVFGDPAGITVVNALANAAGPWLLVAFVAGSMMRSPASGAAAGLVALLVAVAWYYGRWIGGPSFPAVLAAAWLVLVLVSGPAFGFGGATWRRDPAGRRGTLAVAALVGALLAEAAHRLILLEAWDGLDVARTYAQLAIADVVIAVIVVAGYGRRRWPAVLLFSAILGLGWVGVLFALDIGFDLLIGD